MLQETVERTSMLCEGVKAYVRFAGGEWNYMLKIWSFN